MLHFQHTNSPEKTVKPSHLHTPRQLADCTFTGGNIDAVQDVGHSVAFWLSACGLGFLCGLLVAGVL